MSALQSENHAPEPHPMDPRRGSHLSLGFSAFLCWLLNLPAMTEPAIVGMAVTGECVFVASADDPSFMLDPHSAAQPPVPPGTRPGPTPDTAAGTRTVRSRSAVILTAARTLLNTLEAGRALSTPVLRTAMIRPGDRVLEPSAGTGILAVMARCAKPQASGFTSTNWPPPGRGCSRRSSPVFPLPGTTPSPSPTACPDSCPRSC